MVLQRGLVYLLPIDQLVLWYIHVMIGALGAILVGKTESNISEMAKTA